VQYFAAPQRDLPIGLRAIDRSECPKSAKQFSSAQVQKFDRLVSTATKEVLAVSGRDSVSDQTVSNTRVLARNFSGSGVLLGAKLVLVEI